MRLGVRYDTLTERVGGALNQVPIPLGFSMFGMPAARSVQVAQRVGVFAELGVAPEKIQIAHTGDTDDLDHVESLLAQGVYIGLDRYGLDIFLPIEKRNATVLELLARGHAERMFLSQDFDIPIANGLDWYPPEVIEALEAAGAANGWSMTLLFEQIIPELTERGMSVEALHTMMVENPRRWLGR